MEKENRELFNYLVSLGLILPIQTCTHDSCLKKGKKMELKELKERKLIFFIISKPVEDCFGNHQIITIASVYCRLRQLKYCYEKLFLPGCRQLFSMIL
ncbi:hypothetical protein BpHYR1_052827 [Brachionus plicatilis]|uniref:Uncharacterized protein n=1 Tax=Brachionus plicatilis TaxID=10195 RepID=A0A3M7PAJ8_BRAPC|nr:hypothetical protein BpHYR1_052827 [Brachionus plicatilis]